MTDKIKKMIFAALAVLALATPLAVVSSVSAQGADSTIKQPQQGLCQGGQLQIGGECNPADDRGAGSALNRILKLVINIFSLVVGVISVIMIIVGGLKYITSGGDTGNIQGAKNTILYAVIGLVVVALAQIIVRFVLNRVATESETA